MLPFSIPPEVLAALQTIVLALSVYFALFSLALAIWTFRDSRRRTRNWLVHIFGVALVLAFNLPGLLLYMLVRPGETLAQQYDRSLEEAVILQDLEKQLACPRCKRAVQPDFLVCPHCTTQLRRACHRSSQASSLASRSPRTAPVARTSRGCARKAPSTKSRSSARTFATRCPGSIRSSEAPITKRGGGPEPLSLKPFPNPTSAT